MKYKYIGKFPAIILVGEKLKKVDPGEEINVQVAPSQHFILVPPPKPKPLSDKPKPIKKQQEVIHATSKSDTTKFSRLGE